jgi:hypothetical protein
MFDTKGHAIIKSGVDKFNAKIGIDAASVVILVTKMKSEGLIESWSKPKDKRTGAHSKARTSAMHIHRFSATTIATWSEPQRLTVSRQCLDKFPTRNRSDEVGFRHMQSTPKQHTKHRSKHACGHA